MKYNDVKHKGEIMQSKGIKAFSGCRNYPNMPVFKFILMIACLLLTACSSSRRVIIDSSQTARIDNASASCMICEQTPCTLTFTRKTFQLFDSSAGYMGIKAILPDGKCQEKIIDYREVKDGETVFFDFEDGEAKTDPLEMFLRKKGIKRRPCK